MPTPPRNQQSSQHSVARGPTQLIKPSRTASSSSSASRANVGAASANQPNSFAPIPPLLKAGAKHVVPTLELVRDSLGIPSFIKAVTASALGVAAVVGASANISRFYSHPHLLGCPRRSTSLATVSGRDSASINYMLQRCLLSPLCWTWA